MPRSVLPFVGGVLAAIVLGLASGWLLLHRPTLHGTSYAGGFACRAPYDIVLNGARSTGRGEHPHPDDAQVDLRCHDVAKTHVELGVTAGVLAILVAAVTAVAAVRRARE